MTSLIEGLTEEQSKAVTKLQEEQKTKFFSGISIQHVIADFITANNLQSTDPVKAISNEKALFALCGYDPSNIS
jgi:hypothetical protein